MCCIDSQLSQLTPRPAVRLSISFASAQLPRTVANHTAAAGLTIANRATQQPSCDQEAVSLTHSSTQIDITCTIVSDSMQMLFSCV